MAKTFTAPFAQTQKTGSAVVTSALANIGNNTPTGIVQVAIAGNDGALVTRLTAMPRGTVTDSSLVLFMTKSTEPNTYYLIDSELMVAYTLSTTTAIPETTFANISPETPLRLEAGDKLFVGSQVALGSGIVFKAEWIDF